MRGKHRVIVSTKRLKYDFEIRKNLTIIRGDSATGKTTLVDMIQEYVNNPTGSPVELICDKKCYVLEGALWKGQLAEITDSIVFIDEGNDFITGRQSLSSFDAYLNTLDNMGIKEITSIKQKQYNLYKNNM